MSTSEGLISVVLLFISKVYCSMTHTCPSPVTESGWKECSDVIYQIDHLLSPSNVALSLDKREEGFWVLNC
jgi:hypothetical protein